MISNAKTYPAVLKGSRGTQVYKKLTKQKYVFMLVILLLCVASTLCDIMLGPYNLSFTDAFYSIFAPEKTQGNIVVIVRAMRIPIALMALSVGASLGLAGAVMQTILNNPLASPYTLGVGASASFGAALAIITGIGVIPGFGEYAVSINAFAFAMLTCVLIYFMGNRRDVSSNTMILAGIALLFIFQAFQALLQYRASEMQVQTIVFWTFGSLQKTTWRKLGFVALVLGICFPLLMRRSWAFTCLLMGDEKARSLGVNIDRLKFTSFVLISMLTAAAVCFVGTIGFVGLAGPHIARMLVGEDQRFYLPVSALSGALMLSVASVASKLVVPGVVFPIGIITSIIGVPFFLFLILKRRS